MAVLSGTATIRWGVADLTDDLEKSTWGGEFEAGGVEIQAQAGDVFVIPAGVSHKTHNASPGGSLELLSPGKGRGIEATNGNVKEALKKIELAGFTMMGAFGTVQEGAKAELGLSDTQMGLIQDSSTT